MDETPPKLHAPTVLVTGGAGYLGRVLVHELLAPRGATGLAPREVRVFDRVPFEEASRGDRRDHLVGHGDPRVVSVQGDLRDAAAVRRACEGVDVVIHSAALVDWGHHPDATLEAINVQGTDHVIQGALEGGAQAVVYTSTEDVVFTGRPIRDGDEQLPYPRRFVNGYCRTKADAEVAVRSANGRARPSGGTLRTVALRPVGIWGEGDPFHVSSLLRMAQRGWLPRMGDGRARCLHVYVHNVAHAHLRAARALLEERPDVAGEVFFVTDSDPANFFDYLEPVIVGAGQAMGPWSRALPRGPMLALGTAMDAAAWALRPLRRFTPPVSRFAVKYVTQDFVFNGERARQALGYEPVFTEAESRERTTAWFRRHGPVAPN